MKTKEYIFRRAEPTDLDQIWGIVHQAIIRRKNDGSNQWQDGYPNVETIKEDLKNKNGFILEFEKNIIVYLAIIKNDEPAYDAIVGDWLSHSDFIVMHRLAVHEDYLGKGWMKIIFQEVEKLAIQNSIFSIKADTNFDNYAMLHIFEKYGYQYCGKVYFRDSERLAYEKVLNIN